MKATVIGAQKYTDGGFASTPLYVDGAFVSPNASQGSEILNYDNCYIFPGFADVHVHLREPGFSYKETITTGTMAAAHGGYTAVCPMPNLSPAPDCEAGLQAQLDIIRRSARVNVYPYGTITRGELGQELADMDALAGRVVAFSDDGKGMQSGQLMERAMRKAKELGKIIAAHCEDERLLHGGCIHEGEYARLHGLPGICSRSEWEPIARDLDLAAKTGCAYHVCHVSAKESVSLIRQAKASGVNVTCETAPHYLVLNDMCLQDEGRFKMNPPVRSEADRVALIEGISDGTIDMIATDHAPHSADEKSKGLRGSLMGVVGLETAFPVLYTQLVLRKVISLEQLVALMSINPRQRFGLPGGTSVGDEADFCIFDLNDQYLIDSGDFLSMGRATPFEGMEVFGRIKFTAVKGEAVWQGK